jgi:hypothetical protein
VGPISFSRRAFLCASLEAGAILAAAPLWAEARSDLADAGVLFDPRWRRSLIAARAAFGTSRYQPVGSDATQLATLLFTPGRSQRILLRGVTTDSVPFCLEQCARAGTARLRTDRLDRDLFIWRLEVNQR